MNNNVTPMITFLSMESESTFLDPRRNFEQVEERFQVRIDPLTGRTGHFSHFGAIKPQKLPLESYGTAEIKGFCPFCLENRQGKTPRFPANIAPEGRLARNEAFLIPNLFPYDVWSSVLVITNDHVVPLEGFTRQRLLDAFSLGIEFLQRIKAADNSFPYNLMAWNYMPPSGGGLVHPHQQYFATRFPGNRYMDELRASQLFHSTTGLSFWTCLVEEEAVTDARYIARLGDSHWLTPFVSLGLLGDVMCVFPEVYHIDQFTSCHIEWLIEGLVKVFQYYVATGICSFNASLFLGPLDQEYFSCHFRISPRTFLNTRDFAPDLNFYQALLGESISVVMPEDLAADLRTSFL